MNLEQFSTYALAKPGTGEDMPFGPGTLVFRVGGKIFALYSFDSDPKQVNLKCDPGHAIELRERYESVQPGYHMNKKHWNTVVFDGTIPLREVKEMIDHSYDLVVGSLKKSERLALGL